jgi:hypothetical protein
MTHSLSCLSVDATNEESVSRSLRKEGLLPRVSALGFVARSVAEHFEREGQWQRLGEVARALQAPKAAKAAARTPKRRA